MTSSPTEPLPGPDAVESAQDQSSPAGGTWPDVNRRESPDRRRGPTRFWGALLGPRRRLRGRRQGEGRDIYVDVFHRSDALLLVGILALNAFDALFTLLWLQRGGAEANPIMRWLLELGDHAFLIQKCFVVGLWLIFLVVHKNFRLARIGLWSLLGVYLLLLLYHFTLVLSGVDPKSGEPPAEQHTAGGSVQTGQNHRDRGLDPQRARPEAHRREAAGAERADFVVGPATLGPDGQHRGPANVARTARLRFGMGDQRQLAFDEPWQLVLDEGPETPALPDLWQTGVTSLFEAQDELLAERFGGQHPALPEAFFDAAGAQQNDPLHPHGRRRDQHTFEYKRPR